MTDPATPLVLIVEDDPVIAQLLTILCGQLGLRSLRAPSGEAALNVLERERPQLVTLDLNLPRLSGQEVLAHMRADAAVCDTPVVVVSAMEPDDEVRAQANAVVKKPFDVEGLIGLIQGLIAAPRPLLERAVGQ